MQAVAGRFGNEPGPEEDDTRIDALHEAAETRPSLQPRFDL